MTAGSGATLIKINRGNAERRKSWDATLVADSPKTERETDRMKEIERETEMTSNMGSLDRMLRLLLGLALLVSPLLNIPAIWSDGTWAYASMAIGLILTGTALFNFCPLYKLLGISTCRL